MLVFGHRGAAGYEPENTLRSVRKALALGVPWIEIDVHRVADELVVIHDPTLDRTTDGAGAVESHTLAYLRALDAGGGERIPLLDEVLDAIGERCGLNVELKGRRTAEPTAARLRRRIERGWAVERLLVSAADPALLDAVSAAEPAIPRGRVVGDCTAALIDDGAASGLYSIHPHQAGLTAELVDYAQRRGLKVFAYTVNEPADLQRMAALGVDGVFSDFPDRALAATAPRAPSA